MNIEKAYYVGIHGFSFHPGEPAEIMRVFWCLPVEGSDYRLCFEICYKDGFIDVCPVDDAGAYEIRGAVASLVWKPGGKR